MKTKKVVLDYISYIQTTLRFNFVKFKSKSTTSCTLLREGNILLGTDSVEEI